MSPQLTPLPNSRLGEVVLFCLDPAGEYRPPTYRPLLITRDGSVTVSGELFLVWEDDRTTQWCRQRMFYAPTAQTRTVEICAAEHGERVGQWITLAEYYHLTQEQAQQRPRVVESQKEGKETPVDRPVEDA